MSDRPNPGSIPAVEQGCICAVFDNNRGVMSPFPTGDWWITGGCPVHDPREVSDEELVDALRAALNDAPER